MGLRRKTYADPADRQILKTPLDARQKRLDFVTEVFDRLVQDRSFERRVLLNVGAGRGIVPDEVPFFRQFDRLLLLEPDDDRRNALAEDPAAAGAELLGDPVQQLDVTGLPPADYVLCKWVLQHLPSDDVAGAVETLKAACAPGGTVGIFSASSPGEPYFLLSAPPDVIDQLPEHLRPTQGRVTREQFEELIADDFGVEFITTHHLDRAWLAERFAGWDVRTTVSDFGALYLQARKPPHAS